MIVSFKDPRLGWLNPPSKWKIDEAAGLTIEPDPATDFWQRTHYGFSADSGHLLYAGVSADAVITAEFSVHPAHQFDQAGLMIRSSADCWVKASVESEQHGPAQLGAVVTNAGYSDWSLQDFPYGEQLRYALRIRRAGADLEVHHAANLSAAWRPLRVAHMFVEPGAPVIAGVYACSPRGAGFRACISSFSIAGAEG